MNRIFTWHRKAKIEAANTC